MSPTGDLLVTLIFLRGGSPASLLKDPRALHQHCTELAAAHPSWVTWLMMISDKGHFQMQRALPNTLPWAWLLAFSSRGVAAESRRTVYHSVHFITHQSFAFY